MIPNLYHKDFFYIEKDHLKDESVFSFQLYIYNPQNREHTLFLHPNSPLDEPRVKLLDFILERGGMLAINRKQKKSFLRDVNLKEEDIPGLKAREEGQEEKNRKMAIYMLEKHRAEKPFHLHQEIKAALLEDNFTQLIEEARLEICCFPVDVSDTVSLCPLLAEELLHEDNFINRAVTLCYFMAKILKIKDDEGLADVIVAAFFAHLGLTQLPYSMIGHPSLELSSGQVRLYQKHPGLTQHLLRKSKINLSDRCLKVILEHHERADGSGYPHHKIEEYLDSFSLLVGAAYHLIEQTSGLIDGKKKTFESVIKKMTGKEITNGLEWEFGDTILDAIRTLLVNKQEIS